MIPTQAIGCGAGRLAFAEAAGFALDVTRYPAGFQLAVHAHERANLCIVLEGALTEWAGRSERDCPAATVIAKPQGEVHRDRFHERGACCVNVTIEHERLARIHEVHPALTEVRFEEDPALVAAGRRMSLELRRLDELSPLVLEGLVLELIAALARTDRRRAPAVPGWVEEAREFLHDNFSAKVSLSAVALAIGRHPVTVAQHFRRRFGLSVGEYVRRLRVEHVARRLVAGQESLAQLADEAGFSDQSHMQRVFKACLGVTPTAYRRARR